MNSAEVVGGRVNCCAFGGRTFSAARMFAFFGRPEKDEGGGIRDFSGGF
jgi:hypothetical protein